MTERGSALAVLATTAGWLGAALLFAVVVAPAAFAVLPSRSLAGALVGRVLPTLFWLGLVIGVVVAVLSFRGDGATRRWIAVSGLAMSVACAAAQLVVAPRIARLRAAIGPSLEALAADDPRRAAFGRLHAISVGWLGLAMLAAGVALVAAILAARGRG
jgi:hypothetical protein